MALNIKNAEVETLAGEIALLEGTTKTEVIRRALTERRQRLTAGSPAISRKDRLRQYLELRVWPSIPPKARRRWSKEEESRRLGYGKWGEPV